MNLYVYVKDGDLSEAQEQKLEQNFDNVIYCEERNFDELMADESEKVVALDPDVVDWKFENDLIDKIPNLRAICLETTGYEWVDCEYCATKGIAVTNAPHYATNAVAEKCVMMALALAKKLPLFEQEGGMNWDPEFIGEDMWDKPTDIVGFGEIGRALAKKLDGIIGRKEICYYSRHDNDPTYHYLAFDQMLAKSEIMILHIIISLLTKCLPKANICLLRFQKMRRAWHYLMIYQNFSRIQK